MTRKLAGLLFQLQTMVLSRGAGTTRLGGDHLPEGRSRLWGFCQLLREVFGKEIICTGINAVCKAVGRWEEL